jgi:hypothetical protein
MMFLKFEYLMTEMVPEVDPASFIEPKLPWTIPT